METTLSDDPYTDAFVYGAYGMWSEGAGGLRSSKSTGSLDPKVVLMHKAIPNRTLPALPKEATALLAKHANAGLLTSYRSRAFGPPKLHLRKVRKVLGALVPAPSARLARACARPNRTVGGAPGGGGPRLVCGGGAVVCEPRHP